MNEIETRRKAHGTTQVADGYPRLRWTLAEFEKLSELGFFGGIDRERERIELVEGELIPMQAKGGRHERVKTRLQKYLTLALGAPYDVFGEPGWRPGKDNYFEPEIIVCRAGFEPDTVAPGEVLLLVEVADTSLAYDRTVKARIYGALGVREYWVVNAITLETIVHREPAVEGYRSVVTVRPSETLVPHLLPALALSLGGFGIA